MKVKTGELNIFIVSCAMLLTFSFPYSTYLRYFCMFITMGYLLLKQCLVKMDVKNLYVLCYVFFAIWGLVSYTWAISHTGVREHALNMLVTVVANLVPMLFIWSRKKNFCGILGWLIPILGVYLIQAVAVGKFNSTGRFSPTGAVNQFGISTSYIFFIVLYCIKSKKYSKVFLWPILVLSGALTLMTGSRKALLNLVLFICIVFLFSKYDKNIIKNLKKLVLLALLVLVAIYLIINVDFLYDLIGKRFVTLWAYYSGEVTEDLSALRREYMKNDAILLFLKNPIKGIGLNNFKYAARYNTYAHSNYYELLCCLGLVGALLYYIPIFIIAIKSFFQWKHNYEDAVIPFVIICSFIFTEFSNISYIYMMIHYFLGISAGLVFVNDYNIKTKGTINSTK